MARRSLSHDPTSYAWKPGIDYHVRPELYRVGKGEQGVLICEPYKSEILPLWRFRTPEIARKSAEAITRLFHAYLDRDDFVGADMARKFLQMGYTRARRYTNFKGGRKYAEDGESELPRGTGDPAKAESATIFHKAWRAAEANPDYAHRKSDWKKRYG